jgi:hypothetical protein
VRKVGIARAGSPHRAPTRLTVSSGSAPLGLPISVRVSLDSIGEITTGARSSAADKAGETIAAMEALARQDDQFQFGIAATIFATNMQDAKNILAWARKRDLDVVFNMLRFTDAMLGNRELENTIRLKMAEEDFMRQFFLERVQESRC